jgi:hypothetical protein
MCKFMTPATHDRTPGEQPAAASPSAPHIYARRIDCAPAPRPAAAADAGGTKAGESSTTGEHA